ncbi:MAG TPA: hypothetical protein VIY73_16885 [Polyangiaceae bacterium]
MAVAVTFLSRRLAPAALVAGLLVACGARGPLDITVIEQGPADADVDAPGVDAGIDASETGTGDGSLDAADAPDEGAPGFDGGPIVNCGSCVIQNCGSQLLTCIQSTTCRTALQCVVTTCLSGGTPDPTCVLGCANGDATALGDLVGAFECVIGTCGAQCTSVLGGLGGLGGGGGGGGGAGGGGDGG